MEKAPLRQLDTPFAKELAETLLLQHDMQESLKTIKLWHEKYAEKEPGSEERTIGASLFRDVVVQFVGCFDKTAKFPLSSDEIYGKLDGGPAFFQWFQDCRDAYAAHKFGAQRQCVVGVISIPGQDIGIGNLNAVYKGAKTEDGPKLIEFMKLAATHLDKKVESLQQKALEAAKAMSAEQINALPVARVYGVDPSEIGMSRQALQKARLKNAPGSNQVS